VVSIRAQITANGGTEDDLYIYLRTGDGDDETLDSDIDNATANVFADPIIVSNDDYLVIKCVAPTVGAGDRTVSYHYQGWDVS